MCHMRGLIRKLYLFITGWEMRLCYWVQNRKIIIIMLTFNKLSLLIETQLLIHNLSHPIVNNFTHSHQNTVKFNSNNNAIAVWDDGSGRYVQSSN